MNKKSLLIAAVAVLVIAIIGITYLLFTEIPVPARDWLSFQ